MVEAVLKVFPLSLLFRGFFPGVFFVLSYNVADHGWAGALCHLARWSDWLPLAVIAGVFVYVVYRAAIYPVAEYALDSLEERRQGATSCCGFWRMISAKTVDRLLKQWKWGADGNSEISQRLTAWSDYTNLLYCSALCIAVGALFGHPQPLERKPDWTLIWVVIVFLVAGLISDLRVRTVSYQLHLRGLNKAE